MRNLDKSQLKVLLTIMGDELRPNIHQLWVEEHEGNVYLIATDSHQAVAYLTSLDVSYVGKVISYDQLNRFFKLMERKEVFDEDTAKEMLHDAEVTPPKLMELLTKYPDTELGATRIGFNAKYALNLEKVAGQPLYYRLTGPLDPMVADVDGSKFILMPIKG